MIIGQRTTWLKTKCLPKSDLLPSVVFPFLCICICGSSYQHGQRGHRHAGLVHRPDVCSRPHRAHPSNRLLHQEESRREVSRLEVLHLLCFCWISSLITGACDFFDSVLRNCQKVNRSSKTCSSCHSDSRKREWWDPAITQCFCRAVEQLSRFTHLWVNIVMSLCPAKIKKKI